MVSWRKMSLGACLGLGILWSVCVAEEPPSGPSLSPQDLFNGKASISYPYEGDRLRGLVPVFGVADASSFGQYRLEFGEGGAPAKWEVIRVSRRPEPTDPKAGRKIRWDPNYGAHGNLGDWEVGAPSYSYSTWKRDLNGRYTLRLIVEDEQGRKAEDRVTVNVGPLLTRIHGGTAASPDGRLRLAAPPQSIGYGAFVVVCLFPTKEAAVPDGYRALGPVYELNPPNFQVLKPLRLSCTYRIEELDFDGDRRLDVPEERVGLYWFSPVEQVWVRYREQERVPPGTVTASFHGSARYQAYLALLADLKPPAPPLLVVKSGKEPLAKAKDGVLESPSPWVEFFGRAEPDAVVRLLCDGKEVAETEADLAGRFRFRKTWLEEEAREFRAVAVDRSGQESGGSGLLRCRRNAAAEERLESLSILGSKECAEGEWVVCKAVSGAAPSGGVDGPDDGRGRPSYGASLVARVRSTFSDPDGIAVELRPVPGRPGTYVTSVRIGRESDSSIPQIAAMQQGETVQFQVGDDATDCVKVTYTDRTGPEAPAVSSETHPCALQAWFVEGTADIVSTAEPKLGWETIDGRWGAQTSVRGLKIEDWRLKTGEPEGRDQKAEDRGQRTGGRGQKAEVRRQRPETRYPIPGTRYQRAQSRRRKEAVRAGTFMRSRRRSFRAIWGSRCPLDRSG